MSSVWRRILQGTTLFGALAAINGIDAIAEQPFDVNRGPADGDWSGEMFDEFLISRQAPAAGAAQAAPPTPCPQPCQPYPGAMQPGQAPTGPSSPGEAPQVAPVPSFTPAEPSLTPGGLALGEGGQAATSLGMVPTMLGDGFGGNANVFVDFELGESDPDHPTKFIIASPSMGGGSGQVKLMENGSPLIRDRMFINYSNFWGVPLGPDKINVQRFTPGFEKTFLDGNCSFELRIPMALTISPEFDHDEPDVVDQDFVLGNVTMFFKTRLYGDDVCQLTAGLGVTAPSAPKGVILSSDFDFTHQDGIIKNQAVHLMPFLGGVYTPDDRFFAQGMLQVDCATNGNDVLIERGELGPLTKVGRLNDATFLYVSVGTGYWLRREPDSWLSGLAPIVELHYNRSLQKTDSVAVPDDQQVWDVQAGSRIGARQNIEVINFVAGVNVFIEDNKTLTVGYSTPIEGSDASRAFEHELRVMFNWYFGPPTRTTPIQF
jgi:hypothetical protein